jgi:hypothetical protein
MTKDSTKLEGLEKAVENFLKLNQDDLKKLNPHYKGAENKGHENASAKTKEAKGTSV